MSTVPTIPGVNETVPGEQTLWRIRVVCTVH